MDVILFSSRFVRVHLGVTLFVTCITAWFSYAYFHIDEYFQVIELTRLKLGQVELWALPWEHTQRMRPWLQPFLYWLIARFVGLFGVRDVFDLAFVFRLVTGLANVGALALFLRTTLPWFGSSRQVTTSSSGEDAGSVVVLEQEQRLHIRVVTLVGFLPYLFVRTSSESGSMAALTIGFAILLAGAREKEREKERENEQDDPRKRTWVVPMLDRFPPVLLAGFLFGLAFEMRFQTAIIALGLVAWLRIVGRASARGLGVLVLGGVLALFVGALIDRWGYGVWTFPAWTYFQANVVEGVAGFFGTEPPFAYFWMLPANVFAPVVLAMLALAIVAWWRCPRHPVTWATLPFFVIHNLLSHKEERFLFPIAILATALVTMALGPSSGRPLRVATWAWNRRRGPIGKVLSLSSFLGMLLLAFFPLGWHHNVRFTRYVHDHLGDELHATVLPDIDLNLPAFHPHVYDLDKADPEEIARRIEAGTARQWLVADSPVLRTGSPGLDEHATLVWSELPVYGDPEVAMTWMRYVDSYNAHRPAPMRALRFRSLYKLDRNNPDAAGVHEPH